MRPRFERGYANRLEIRNPGFSLKSQDHLGEPGSQLRNPKICSVYALISSE
jgi:ATP-dependent DNA helicase RecG